MLRHSFMAPSMSNLWKQLAPLLIAASLGGCAAPKEYTAVGPRNSAGVPSGEFRLLNSSGHVRMRGRMVNGQMDGLWVFFETTGTKVAEFNFVVGAASGPYRTYFGSRFDPSAAGKIESEGRLEHGRPVGRFTAFRPDGGILCSATFGPNGAPTATVGAPAQAQKLTLADLNFLNTLVAPVHRALQ
jgi:hypothetical protein